MKEIDFNELFILDLANNHQGDVGHGLRIIKELGAVVRRVKVNAAIKFQFRQLDTFIHPDFVSREDVKHIPRFLGTRLDWDAYEVLLAECREQNVAVMCTPFDEESVDRIVAMDFDAIKIASCSLNDRPLVSRISTAGLPVVASTGGSSLQQIEFVDHLLSNAGISYAFEHCVSIYPTPTKNLQLNQIELLKTHFQDVPIGWSTHEDPEDMITIQVAFAKGATMFERHVGIETEKFGLNAYSSTPSQIEMWMKSFHQAKARCGSEKRPPATMEEREALRSLQRGVFARTEIELGQPLKQADVFFAMPVVDDGLTSSSWASGLTANRAYKAGESIDQSIAEIDQSDREIINQISLRVRGLLKDARIVLSKGCKGEISHHYGLRRFREFGAVIIDVINREYCKKLIVQLPRQKHPYHHHKLKEETFHVLYGSMEVEVDGNSHALKEGDLFLVEKNKWHKFSSMNGVIFEEISTTHHKNDSFYEDPQINAMTLDQRKTELLIT